MTFSHQNLLEQAKACHSASGWRSFTKKFGSHLETTKSSKLVSDIFNVLKKDRLAKKYDESIWLSLLAGSISSWDLALAQKIANFICDIPSADTLVQAADIYLQSGEPSKARVIANRALRLRQVSIDQKIQLQMAICSSYVEEGKSKLTSRYLLKMNKELTDSTIKIDLKANVLNNMARAHFFLGRYLEAAKNFEKSYKIFFSLQQWELATKALFNAAACLHNSGPNHEKKAFSLIKQCMKISKENNLPGPLSHCYGFFGTDCYQNGKFLEAAKNYRRALDLFPKTDTSFRRIHITSMLALTMLKSNQLTAARKFSKITFDLATLDKSERFRTRYAALEAELLWHEGKFMDSQNLIIKITEPLIGSGINTLEELSAVNRLYLQSSQLFSAEGPAIDLPISEQLKTANSTWLDHLLCKTEVLLKGGKIAEAQALSIQSFLQGSRIQSKYFRAKSLQTALCVKLKEKNFDSEFHNYIDELKGLCNQFEHTDIPVYCNIIEAAAAYHLGDFEQVKVLLKRANSIKSISRPLKITVQCWSATIHGHSSRLTNSSHVDIIASLTALFFSPSLKPFGEKQYIVNDLYIVDLSRFPVLSKFIRELIHTPNGMTPEKLQKNVWNESLGALGWQQKIRNTIMRLRDLFPYSIAPFILDSNHNVRLFTEAIHISNQNDSEINLDHAIRRLLNENGAQNSKALALQTGKSLATTKRSLNRLKASCEVKSQRIGRNIVYSFI